MYTEAIDQLRTENYNGFLALTLSHNGNQAATYAELFVTDDATNTIVTPLEADLTDAYTRWQAAQVIRDGQDALQASAKAQAQAIPDWATWTEAETLAYIDANVTDLTSATVVLRAMAQMLIALRNERWPDLQGS